MIVLSTLNARYAHASFGLRYLLANLGPHRERATLREFTIKRPAVEIVDEILALRPRLVGFGVYIWNTDQTLAVVRLLRERDPGLMIVVGGPEISFEIETQPLFPLVDYVFKGEADFSFRDFIANWVERNALPEKKIIAAGLPDIRQIRLPYAEYTDEDVRHRTIYVEASRGCPYKCEYCLSSLDVSVRNFDTEFFLTEIDRLIERGARQFKFVDRTFNLSPAISARILGFFLERIERGLFLHFEMVPDRLPDELQALIRKFPAGSLQFEIGIQTWNPEVAKNVSRRQNYDRIRENLRFLRAETGVHSHADLIVGLPGETWDSFAAGFNELARLAPDEIQVGILKRLKGTPIVRHDSEFRMVYATASPFQILSNRDLSPEQLIELGIFADFWDQVANSGRFPGIQDRIRAEENPFAFFHELARFLFARFGRTHSIHLRDLSDAVGAYFESRGEMIPRADAMPVPSQGVQAATPVRQRQHLTSSR